jgi:regulatory protein
MELFEEIKVLRKDAKEEKFSCPKDARKKAMDFLARREHSQVELINKLVNKGYLRQIADEVVTTLTNEGLQSNDRFAEAFVQSRINQGKGPIRIRLDLSQRGICDSNIEKAIGESGADWYKLTLNARSRKFGLKKPEDFKALAKQIRFLRYRGFDQEHIQLALKSLS